MRVKRAAMRYFCSWLAVGVLLLYLLSDDSSTSITTILQHPQGVLKVEGDGFTLFDKPFHIRSGTIHYFRVVPQYWRDRLLKMKAFGLNTIET